MARAARPAAVRVPVLPRPVRYAGALACAAVIAYASLTPSAGGGGFTLLGIASDKWLHAVAYAGLSGALAYARLADGNPLDRRSLLLVVGLAVGYGVALELVQAPLPARSLSAPDVVADAVGASAGAAVWAVTAPRLLGQ